MRPFFLLLIFAVFFFISCASDSIHKKVEDRGGTAAHIIEYGTDPDIWDSDDDDDWKKDDPLHRFNERYEKEKYGDDDDDDDDDDDGNGILGIIFSIIESLCEEKDDDDDD